MCLGCMKRQAEADSIAIRAAVGSDSPPRNAEEAENRTYRVSTVFLKANEAMLDVVDVSSSRDRSPRRLVARADG